MKQHHGGQLTLTEIMRDESREKNDDYFGPAGFKGRSKDGVETRDHTFGTFSGQIAVHKDYNPTKELETIHRSLVSVASNSYGQEALDFICDMTEKQRHAAVVILQGVEDSIVKFKARLQDLAVFFTPENADKFNRYFTHDLNSLYFRVEYTNGRNGPTLKFKRGASIYEMVRGFWADKLEFDWPTTAEPVRDRTSWHPRRCRVGGGTFPTRYSRTTRSSARNSRPRRRSGNMPTRPG